MICLDSTCIIDFLRGRSDAVKAVRRCESQAVTTEINRFEVLFGIHRRRLVSTKELQAANSFFDAIDVLPLESAGSELAAKVQGDMVKTGRMINQNDVLIAGIMASRGCKEILTRNIKDFSRLPGTKVVGY